MLMSRWIELAKEYFHERFFLFLLVMILMVMGVVFGSLSVNSLGTDQRQELTQYLRLFFQGFQQDTATPVSDPVYAREAIAGHIKTVLFLLVLGVSVIGVPLILLLVFTRGFILGFTVAFLVQQLAGRGVIFSIMAVLPHQFLVIPVLIILAVVNIDFAGTLVKSRWGRHPMPVSKTLFHCLGVNGAGLLVLTIAGLIEGLITPILIHWVAGLF
jgi:stage II sporulation protein M